MKLIFGDFESYYDQDYSLRKMTPIEYVLDPRFETLGIAIQEGLAGTPYWVDGPDTEKFFAQLPREVAFVTHNALFDMVICALRYDYVPKLSVCTMSIARAQLGHVLRSVSLDSVARHLGMDGKLGALAKVMGMRFAQIKAIPSLYRDFVAYGLDDVGKCAGIFDQLVRHGDYPVEELAHLNSVIRCATQPQFLVDQNVLHQHLAEVREKKARLLVDAGVSHPADLMSNDKFANALRMLGIDPPMKLSKTTGQETYAFAKTDPAFIDLSEHPDPSVQALVAARLGHKTTLEESRTERLIAISNVTWPGNQQRLMPMPMRYSGAHTHRLSGDWKINVQNLPRGGNLRRALIAPPDHLVFTVDASQIEAREVAWICEQLDLVQQFADGDDVYSNFASIVFGFPVNKKTNPTERFVGKQAILGLGYGLGHKTFVVRLKSDSKNQTGTTIELSLEEGQRIVKTYRSTYSCVPRTWNMLNHVGIPALAGGGEYALGPCFFEKGVIHLPNGMKLFYHDLKYEVGEWWFTYGGKRKKLYGGKILENICQALARIIVMDAKTRIEQRLAEHNVRMALQVHDELVFVIRQEILPLVKQVSLEEMSRRPFWAPTLPLAAEAGWGASYAEAK